MPLAQPRQGESVGFGIYPSSRVELTLANPEMVIWASIRHWCSQRAAEFYGLRIHKIYNKRTRSAVARNVGLYIKTASEFYDAASNAKPNTAPLFYYYSFLNLAKALCEIHHPRLHRRPECYAHGLSWRPDPQNLVRIEKEKVTVRGRGIWHLLWESLMQKPCLAANPTRLPVLKLFSQCPEIGVEFETLYGEPRARIYLNQIEAMRNGATTWLKFSIARERIRETGLSAPALLAQISSTTTNYVEVLSDQEQKGLRTFQSATSARLRGTATPYSALRNDVLSLNMIAHLGDGTDLEYSLALQKGWPVRVPQLMVSYTILFWLGSLVRYDPHSVYELMDSPDWILIDGFMTQSRVWLLELFRWALYQQEIILRSSR
jgi:hypothetical protein